MSEDDRIDPQGSAPDVQSPRAAGPVLPDDHVTDLDEVLPVLADRKFRSEAAKDAAQEVLASFLGRRLELGRKRVADWIRYFTSAVSRRLNGTFGVDEKHKKLADRESRRIAPQAPEDPTAGVLASESSELVAKVFLALSDEDRELVIRRFKLGQSTSELALRFYGVSTNRSRNSVSQRIRHVKKRLHAEFVNLLLDGTDPSVIRGGADGLSKLMDDMEPLRPPQSPKDKKPGAGNSDSGRPQD